MNNPKDTNKALAAILEQFEKDVLEVIGKDDRDYSQDNADARSKELLVACATSCNEVRKDQRLRLTALLERYKSGGES